MVNYTQGKTNRLESKLKNFFGKIYVPIWKSRYDPKSSCGGIFNFWSASRLVSEYEVVSRFMYIGLAQLKDYKAEKAKQRRNQAQLIDMCHRRTASLYENASFRGPFPVKVPEIDIIWNRTLNGAKKMKVAKETELNKASPNSSEDISDKLQFD
jgi:hypothetical protein